MRVTSLFFLLAGLATPIAAFAQGDGSVERGLQPHDARMHHAVHAQVCWEHTLHVSVR